MVPRIMTASLVVLLTATASFAKEKQTGVDPAAYQQMVDKAIDYLRTQGQADDGSFSAQAGPAVTGLVTTALLHHGRTPDDPMVAKGLKYLEGFVQDDGGIYQPLTLYKNYETCIGILCFSEANRDGRYDKVVKNAENFVKGVQWDSSEEIDKSHTSYGGAGYVKHKRPDLNNTAFLVEALKAAGNGPDDPAMQKALIFVSRCQNLETEHNTTPFAAKVDDGGFYYTVAAGGKSQAGETANGGLRSYGSMTYAGLKSMIYAGVDPEDERVKAAYDWACKHYTLEENPGMGAAGLFYYYHTFAKALNALGEDIVVDEDGTKHNWRQELVAELAKRQNDQGTWTNENSRWLEGDPNLVTAYCLLTLDYCRPQSE